MEYPRLLECLDADYTRLRQVAVRVDPAAPVPSCPGWTADDLVRHVAVVYRHKAESMRLGRFPEPWPPDTSGESAVDLLDREYRDLLAEFAARKPDEQTVTWYEPEQTVGFWIRRMAQETVIHRVDAELALGEPFAEIPDDLALDGIDEVLERFLGYGTTAWLDEWREDYESLPDAPLPPVLARSGERGWLLRATPDGVTVTGADAGGAVGATISGAPRDLLLWLWRRADTGVALSGDPELVDRIRLLLRDATQ